MRVVKDIPYLASTNYADNKDKLDLYLPDGGPDKTRATSGLPVIVSFYGGGSTPRRPITCTPACRPRSFSTRTETMSGGVSRTQRRRKR